MILKVAWRNIWRNPLRSLIVLVSIILGIWAGLFVISFSYGLNQQRVAQGIYSTISHIQVHNPKFEQEERVIFDLPETETIMQALEQQPRVQAYSVRTVFNGMIQSATASRGMRMMGIDPEQEKTVSTNYTKIQEGTWFEATNKRNPIVIGQRLAEVMQVKLGSKVVLTFQDNENNIISARFTIVGLYKTANSKLDEILVYANKRDLYPLIGGDLNHEIAILVDETAEAETVAHALKQELPGYSVKNWKEIAPELGYADELLAVSLLLVMAIIMLALMFCIINNMLMSILERRRELGMLQAIGMNKPRIFSMIVIETIFIGLVAGPIGMLLGWLTISYFGNVGIDLSIFGQGLESFGISTQIYPELDAWFYGAVAAMVFAMALLASVYPAVKALRLNPVQAIRAI
jgi:putative ABC transport system permease protein